MKAVVDIRPLWHKNISKIANDEKIDDRISKVFFALLDFLYRTNWVGACHGISAILYVIYEELGFKSKLCTGIICHDIWMSGHSWIELNGRVYDAACYFPAEGCPKVTPVFNGIEVGTMEASNTLYGVAVPYSHALDVQMMLDVNTTLPKALNAKYEELKGASLWQVVDNICLLAEISNILNVTGDCFDTTNLAEKYKDTRWVLCNQIPVPVIDSGESKQDSKT